MCDGVFERNVGVTSFRLSILGQIVFDIKQVFFLFAARFFFSATNDCLTLGSCTHQSEAILYRRMLTI